MGSCSDRSSAENARSHENSLVRVLMKPPDDQPFAGAEATKSRTLSAWQSPRGKYQIQYHVLFSSSSYVADIVSIASRY
jgi:hypothetical protein